MNKPRQQILLDSMSLSVGDTTRDIECPFCSARGDVEKNSMIVTRVEYGLCFKCFRVSCGKAGFISTSPSELVKTKLPALDQLRRLHAHLHTCPFLLFRG